MNPKWIKNEYASLMKKINELLKNDGLFKTQEQKEEFFNNCDLTLNKSMKNILDFDILFNRIIFLETDCWQMYFIIDNLGIVKGYKKENDIIELKWERTLENTKYYDIIFSLNIEVLKDFIGLENELLESYLNTIKNNLYSSFNNKNIAIRIKYNNKELDFLIDKYILGHHISVVINGEEKLLKIEDEIFTEEIYNTIISLF